MSSMIVGGNHIDHVGVLRSGATQKVADYHLVAPSTAGHWLRSLTEGNNGQIDQVLNRVLSVVWGLAPKPDDEGEPMIIDIDSTVCEVPSTRKEGARRNYKGQNGLHPLFATRSDTEEIIHSRLREGASQEGHTEFIAESVNNVRNAGWGGDIIVRSDAGFWKYDTINLLAAMNVGYLIAVRKSPNVWEAIRQIPETSWSDILKPDPGEVGNITQVADTSFVSSAQKGSQSVRIIVRRTLKPGKQPQLFDDWQHQVIAVSDPAMSAVDGELCYRKRARIELAIRNLKQDFGLSHLPSGKFEANAGWIACSVVASNMIKWFEMLGGKVWTLVKVMAGRTAQTLFFGLTGRIVNNGGYMKIKFSDNWGWGGQYLKRWQNIFNLPPPHPA